jgi:hypothetical protein
MIFPKGTTLQDSTIQKVEILEGCTPQDIPERVFVSKVPVVMKGLVADWPAVKSCSESLEAATQYLAKMWTDESVMVYFGEADIDGRFAYNSDCTGFNFKTGYGRLETVLEKLAEQPGDGCGNAIYVGSTNIDRWLPGFREQNDISVPGDDAVVSVWLGNQTRIAAHFDFPDNVACVVAGRRRFTLFPPEQIDNLYIGPLDLTPAGQPISLVDFSNPDFDRFPRFQQALESARVAEMEPGDAIFIPSMWWHHVESLVSFNILVNYWWAPTPEVMGAPMDALAHAVLSLRELPQHQRDIWRRMFDRYVFSAGASVYEHIPEAGRGSLAPMDEETARNLRARIAARLR